MRATRTSQTRPSLRNALSSSQVGPNSYQARPWRDEVGWAWWLLCHPSPKVMSATHHRFRESSVVAKRRPPHICVAEFTSQVECRPSTTRRKIAQLTRPHPPIASSEKPSTVSATQEKLVHHR